MFAIPAIGLSVIGDIFQASEAKKETDQQVKEIELQKKQDELAFEERHLKRLDNLKTTVK